jgi:hypothetical protein
MKNAKAGHASQPAAAPNNESPQFALLPSPPAPAQTRAFAPKTRNGKIARLSYDVRDMINRMLRNNLPHRRIREALAEEDIQVTLRNISNWKTRGGYKEWCLEQDRALETRLLQDNLTEHLRKHDAGQLPEVGLQLAATSLSQFLLRPETRQQLINEPDKFSRTLAVLCRLATQIHKLQKYRDDSAKSGGGPNPERVRRDAQKEIETTRKMYSCPEDATGPLDDIPHRNFLPKDL